MKYIILQEAQACNPQISVVCCKIYLLQRRTAGKFNIYCSSSVCIPFGAQETQGHLCLLNLGRVGKISSKIKSSLKCREWLTICDLPVPGSSRKVNTPVVTLL